MSRGCCMLLILGALLPLAGCSRGDAAATLSGTLERDRLELVADAMEPIVELSAREGQSLRAGERILVQDRSISAAQLAGLKAALAERASRLQELQRGARSTERSAALARRDSARTQRDDEQRELARLRPLGASGLVSRAAVDRQTAIAARADEALREAEAALRQVQEGTRAEQLEQAQLAVDQAEARLREAETSGARLELRAPRDVIVDALPYRVGETPARGATVAVVLANGAPFARVFLPEPLRATTRIGAAAKIRISGLEREFDGTVRYVASEPEFTPYYALNDEDRARLAYRTEIELTDPEAIDMPAGLILEARLLPPVMAEGGRDGGR